MLPYVLRNMKEYLEILTLHYKHYPLMGCEDAVKLLYQGEFGGGHMITDENASLQKLREEYAGVRMNNSQSLTEPLGNQIVRVNLQTLCQHGISIEALNRVFVKSANTISGNTDRFKEKLELLVRAKSDVGLFSFGREELLNYLRKYEEDGYPMVSHSTLYRQQYAPAYRVVNESILIKEIGLYKGVKYKNSCQN